MEETIELVFIPAPAMGHLVPAVETAKLLLKTSQRLSITVLIMKLPFADDSKINSYIDSLLISHNQNSRLKLIPLPHDLDALKGLTDMASIFRVFFDSQKANVRDYVNEIKRDSPARLAGFVMDTFCTTMMDVADEFGLPSYVFYTAGAAVLGLHLHLQSLRDDHGENGITSLMDPANLVKKKAKEVKEKSRKALEEGGSSSNFAESFFGNVINNLKLNNCI